MTLSSPASAQVPVRGIRPEAELLLCCARSYMDAGSAGRIRTLIEQDLDWIDVFLTALVHGMLPLIYWSLSAVCREAVPRETLSDFRDHYEANARRSRALTEELLRLLDGLESRGIAAIPYKGPALVASIYGDLPLRPFADLDIL